jgi:oxygen-dependent protoporphyrinogen oxidase
MKDRLIEPIVGGIFAGDIDRLDASVATPVLAAAPRSLMASMLKMPRPSGPLFRAPKRGMSRIVEALVERIGPERIRPNAQAGGLSRNGARWDVTLSSGGRLAADDVIIAAPPFAAAHLLRRLDSDLGDRLGEIRSLSTAAVLIAFEGAEGLPAAGGLLVPRVEGRAIIAATFASTKWPGRTPSDRVVLRAFVGGARAPDLLATTGDDELVSLVLDDLGRYLPLPKVRSSRVVRFAQATPSPEVGHRRRLHAIRSRALRWPGLHFAGGAYGGGVGFASCVAHAAEVAAIIAGGPSASAC